MHVSKEKNLTKGFTLVELAMVLLISGIITAALLAILDSYNKSIKREKAARAIENAKVNLAGFLSATTRYPCPANPALLPSDPNFGREDCTLATVPGARPDLTNDRVLIGTFPVYGINNFDGSSIYLNEKTEAQEGINTNVTDPWDNKLTYAVTQAMTVPKSPTAAYGTAYDVRLGAIAVVDEFNRSTGGIKNNAHYVVISHGPDAIGATTLSGITKACDATYTTEAENCNGDAVFRDALITISDTHPPYYDDYIGFKFEYDSDLWEKIVTTAGAQTESIRNLNTGNVGIKTAAPTERLDVNGNMRVDNSATLSEVCDNSGDPTHCFMPNSIYNLTCPTNTYMKKVVTVPSGTRSVLSTGNSCQALQFQTTSFRCGIGIYAGRPYLQGLYTDGTPVCVAYVP